MSRDHGATMHRNALCLPDSRAQAYPRCVFLLSERLARWMTDCAIMFAGTYDIGMGGLLFVRCVDVACT